jgi:hypothetical protein
MYDRIAPEEPTKAPVIIKAVFSRVNNKNLLKVEMLKMLHF